MLIKALLPLIAVFKYKYDGLEGKCFGQQIAQVYKSCKTEINQGPNQAPPVQPSN